MKPTKTSLEQAKIFIKDISNNITCQRLEAAKNLDAAFQNLEANCKGQFHTVQKLKED